MKSVRAFTIKALARQLSGADGSTFVLRDKDLCYYVDENAISPLWKGQRFPMTSCISGWSMIHQQAVLIPDIYQDDRIPQGSYRPTFVKSLCMIPNRLDNPYLELRVVLTSQNDYTKGLQNPNSELEIALNAMAHDLRTPIAGMTGLAEFLRIKLGERIDLECIEFLKAITDTDFAS